MPDPDEPDASIEDLAQATRDGGILDLDTIKHNGRIEPRPRDWWGLTVTVDECEDADADPPVNLSHFEMTIIRPDPLLLARLERGQTIRKRDEWDFVFEGKPAPVRRQRALMMLTSSYFMREESDEATQELSRWIALHFLARTSPVLMRCARGDSPEQTPSRRLEAPDPEAAAAALSRDLHVRDSGFVLETLNRLTPFLARLTRLSDDDLSRQTVDRLLGLRPAMSPEEEARHAAMPDLDAAELAEMERLTTLAMRSELDPEGQARLLPLLRRHAAHIKARLRNPARSDKP
jgi:hypothetical protein